LAAKLAEDDPEATLATAPSELEQTRSSRPGQSGFAERLLSKYGWTKGSGLGAQGTGIVNPLYAKVDKRKKKPDAEGGGYVTPAGTGKILGGQKSKMTQEEGKFGAMSEVVKLEGMLRGLDLDVELNREGGGIMQEIGEECGEKYGSVERVYIDRNGVEADGGVVFVQFISQLSALRAVNALEGRVFGGNVIKARFWDREKFEQGLYE
jgi:splicing factor 45